MRRSTHVTAPLLACAAVVMLNGCTQHDACRSAAKIAPCSAASQSRSKTIFGGFGSSFAEHSDDIIAFAVAGGVIIAMKAFGS